MSEVAKAFMESLQQLERDRDVEKMARLFSADAELRRAPRSRAYVGEDGARQFWAEYLDAFARVETRFGAITEGEGRAALEWRSIATNKAGRQVTYDGCSVIECDGGRVRRFRTYYDAASAGMGAAVSGEAVAAVSRGA